MSHYRKLETKIEEQERKLKEQEKAIKQLERRLKRYEYAHPPLFCLKETIKPNCNSRKLERPNMAIKAQQDFKLFPLKE